MCLDDINGGSSQMRATQSQNVIQKCGKEGYLFECLRLCVCLSNISRFIADGFY